MPHPLKLAVRILVPLALLAVAVALVVWWPKGADTADGAADWTCSMHPQVRLPKGELCPLCGMRLVPVSQLNPQAEQDRAAGVETQPIAYRDLYKEVRTVGKLDYSERQIAMITARVAGRIDRVYADFTGMIVKHSDHLVDIYSPNLNVDQGSLITAFAQSQRQPNDREAARMAKSIRERLRLLGLTSEQLDEIERSGQPTTHLTIYAPIGGTVIEKMVREGQYVKEGDMLYRIAELDPLWLYLDIYEYDLAWIRYGQKVEVTVEAYPQETFHGVVTFTDPFLNDLTRSIKVRVNMPNALRRLKPAMYATAVIRAELAADGQPKPTGMEGKFVCPMHPDPELASDGPGKCSICNMELEQVPQLAASPAADSEEAASPTSQALAVPASAVLDTGLRQVAYRKSRQAAYEMVELKVGPRATGLDEQGQPQCYYPVLAGLAAGDEVVVRGGFLLDSQRQIEGLPSLIYPEGRAGVDLHAGHGGAKSSPAAEAKHKH